MSYGEIKQFPAHPQNAFNFRIGREGFDPRWIVIHHTCATFNSTRWTFEEEQASANFIIDEEGTCWRMVNDYDTAFAQGLRSPRGTTLHPNQKSLSIELVHGYKGYDGDYKDEQVMAAAVVVARWCLNFSIPVKFPSTGFHALASDSELMHFSGIMGHSTLTKDRSGDPGLEFPVEAFLAKINKEIGNYTTI